ncbi:reverse transcriptase domain-containing protein [Tanacetum coccineum]
MKTRDRQNILRRRRSLLLSKDAFRFKKRRSKRYLKDLVDKVFNDQIGRNLESYVDDMVIKSTSEEDMLADIKETFQSANTWRSSNNVSRSFDIKHKRSFIREKGRRIGSYLLRKQSPTGSRTQLPRTRKTHTSVGIRSKKAAKIFSGIYAKGDNNKEMPKYFLIQAPPKDNRKELGSKMETKLKGTEPSCEWKLYTDGASSSDSSGTGLMLIDPEGVYAANQPAIREYLQRTKETLRRFRSYTIEHIRRNQNKKVDALIKLALMTFEHLTKEVLVEVLARRSIEENEVLQVETKEEESWMTPIHEYLLSGLLPEDSKESKKIKIKAPQYKLIRGNLHKKSFYTPWLRCIAPPKTDDVIKEIHEGSCNFNMEPHSMVVRIIKQGYYWPSMHRDVARIIQDCEKCKEQSTVRKRAEIGAIAARKAWLFGVPQIISSKDDKHFKEGIFADLCRGLKITQSFSLIIEHMEIISRIKKKLTRSQQGWVDDLPQVSWIHQTLPRNNQKETPFSLTYGSEAIIPTVKSNIAKDDKGRTKEVTKRKESKEVASIEEAYYQNKLHMYHNKRSNHSTYKVGDFVLLLQNNTENLQV